MATMGVDEIGNTWYNDGHDVDRRREKRCGMLTVILQEIAMERGR